MWGRLSAELDPIGFDIIVNLLYINEALLWTGSSFRCCGPLSGGNSKKNGRDFPDGAQKLLGDELQLIQFGGMPKDAKPFKGVGSGVLEIALRYASDAYRVALAVQIDRRIYVLHAFQKKSKKGIETPKRDLDLIKKRYAQAQELAHEDEKTKTN